MQLGTRQNEFRNEHISSSQPTKLLPLNYDRIQIEFC